jgi:hypothetical protein
MTKPIARPPVVPPAPARRTVVHALLAAALFAFGAAPRAHAAEPPRGADAVDLDLLEFLGSGDDIEPDLQRFLASQPAAAAKKPANSQPPAAPAARDTGSTTR